MHIHYHNSEATSDPLIHLIVTHNIIPRTNVRVNQRRDVSQEKPMTFRGDVRPRRRAIRILCARLRSFLGRTGNDTTNTPRAMAVALWEKTTL